MSDRTLGLAGWKRTQDHDKDDKTLLLANSALPTHLYPWSSGTSPISHPI